MDVLDLPTITTDWQELSSDDGEQSSVQAVLLKSENLKTSSPPNTRQVLDYLKVKTNLKNIK